jgi:hypothetical protein
MCCTRLKKTLSRESKFLLGEVLFPHVIETRDKLHYSGHIVVIWDSRTSHDGDYSMDGCTQRHIKVFFLPAYSNNQAQRLHFGISGRERAEAARMKPMKKLNRQRWQIIKAGRMIPQPI